MQTTQCSCRGPLLDLIEGELPATAGDFWFVDGGGRALASNLARQQQPALGAVACRPALVAAGDGTSAEPPQADAAAMTPRADRATTRRFSSRSAINCRHCCVGRRSLLGRGPAGRVC